VRATARASSGLADAGVGDGQSCQAQAEVTAEVRVPVGQALLKRGDRAAAVSTTSRWAVSARPARRSTIAHARRAPAWMRRSPLSWAACKATLEDRPRFDLSSGGVDRLGELDGFADTVLAE
jgi:hypothetical protein